MPFALPPLQRLNSGSRPATSSASAFNEMPGDCSPGDFGSRPRSALLDQRANALLQRDKCLLRRNGGDELVVIPRIFRFRRLLHLEQIGRVNLSAVGIEISVGLL